MKLVEIKFKKFGREYTKKGAYIYSFKKNGQRCSHPSWYEATGSEQTQEDVLSRLQRLNPNKRFEIEEK